MTFHPLKTLLKIIGILAFLWFVGFMVFIYSIQKKPLDRETKTDAIVVWTGWNCRITTGIELLSENLAPKLFISGIKGGYPYLPLDRCRSDYGKSMNLQSEMIRLQHQIYLGPQALSTVGNALETAKWIKEQDVKSVRLVTTAIHMPRSLKEFQRECPDITIIPHPVSLTHFDHRQWYQTPKSIFVCCLEYCKYLTILCGIRPDWKDNMEGEYTSPE